MFNSGYARGVPPVVLPPREPGSPVLTGWLSVQASIAATVLAVVGWLGLALGIGWGLVPLAPLGAVGVACAVSLLRAATRSSAATVALGLGLPVAVLAALARL